MEGDAGSAGGGGGAEGAGLGGEGVEAYAGGDAAYAGSDVAGEDAGALPGTSTIAEGSLQSGALFPGEDQGATPATSGITPSGTAVFPGVDPSVSTGYGSLNAGNIGGFAIGGFNPAGFGVFAGTDPSGLESPNVAPGTTAASQASGLAALEAGGRGIESQGPGFPGVGGGAVASGGFGQGGALVAGGQDVSGALAALAGSLNPNPNTGFTGSFTGINNPAVDVALQSPDVGNVTTSSIPGISGMNAVTGTGTTPGIGNVPAEALNPNYTGFSLTGYNSFDPNVSPTTTYGPQVGFNPNLPADAMPVPGPPAISVTAPTPNAVVADRGGWGDFVSEQPGVTVASPVTGDYAYEPAALTAFGDLATGQSPSPSTGIASLDVGNQGERSSGVVAPSPAPTATPPVEPVPTPTPVETPAPQGGRPGIADMAASGVLGPQAQSSLVGPNFGSGLSGLGSLFAGGDTSAAASNQGFGTFGAPEPQTYIADQVVQSLNDSGSGSPAAKRQLDPWSFLMSQFSPFPNRYNTPFYDMYAKQGVPLDTRFG